MTLIVMGRRRGGVSGIIPASLTRYDGASGSAVFRGAIPFAPGVVTGPSGLTSVRVLVDGAEPAGGIHIRLLDGRHSDNSYRSAYVEFTATCGSAATIPCSVVLGQTRATPDIATPANTVELSPRSWHAAPTLFAITDATYLCNSRVAPLPLVPLTHPGLPVSVVTYLTTFHDSWATTTSTGNAGYDDNYPLICRYLVTGNPAFLAEALKRNQSDNTPTVRQQIAWSYYVADPAFTPASGVAGWTVLNPAGYATTRTDAGAPAEWQDTSLTNFTIYQLTGWEYGKIHIERNATIDATSGFGDGAATAATVASYSPTLANQGYPRQTMRWRLQQGVLGAMLRMDRYINVGFQRYKDPANTAGTAGLSMVTRVQNRITRLEDYANGLNIGVDAPTWFPRLWGVRPSLWNTPDGIPNFQWATAASLWIAYANGIDTRASIPAQIDALADWAQSQLRLSKGYWCVPYQMLDPATLTDPLTWGDAANRTNNTLAVMLAWLLAWKWTRTGDTTARDQYDAMMAQTNFAFDTRPTTVQLESATRKNLGELWYMAYHAAALRAGVNPLTGA